MYNVTEKRVFVYKNKQYNTRAEALAEARKDQDKITLFLNDNYKYRNQEGYWVIKDEGPIDFGSSGGRKTLGYAQGKFEDVVKYAFLLPGFVCYGPGSIEKIVIRKV